MVVGKGQFATVRKKPVDGQEENQAMPTLRWKEGALAFLAVLLPGLFLGGWLACGCGSSDGEEVSVHCSIHCVNTEPGHEAEQRYEADVDCLVCGIKAREMINEVCDLGPGDQCKCHEDCG